MFFDAIKNFFNSEDELGVGLSSLKSEVSPSYFFQYANMRKKEEKEMAIRTEKKTVYIKDKLQEAKDCIEKLNLTDAYIKLSSLLLELSSELSVQNDRTHKYYSFSNNIENKINSIINSKFNSYAQTRWVTIQGVSYTEIYTAFIDTLIELGKLEEANSALREAMRWNPVSYRIHMLYAKFYKRKKQFKNCENVLNRALEFATTNSELAECYMEYAFLKKQVNERLLASALYVQSSRFSNDNCRVKNANANGIELISETQAIDVLNKNNIRIEAGKLVQTAYFNLMLEAKQKKNKALFMEYLETIKAMVISKDKIMKLQNVEIPS